MGFDEDRCPKCGCDLWKEYDKVMKRKQREDNPDECFCFTHGRIKRQDPAKDKFIEEIEINEWSGPLTNTHRLVWRKVYKCHLCKGTYVYPTMLYA